MTHTVAIVQARMASTRAPGKVLACIEGQPMLAHVLTRTLQSGVNSVVVATTDTPADDALARWVDACGLAKVFRGSQDDVLDRYYQCARRENADTIVRVTADDPLKDPEIIDRALAILRTTPGLDYCSNTLRPTFPEGLDIEVFTMDALARAHRQAHLASEREHVTPYIWKNPKLFRVQNFEHVSDLSHWRWTVDKPDDIEFMRTVFAAFRPDTLMSYHRVIKYIEQHPQVKAINDGTVRNEGYLHSIQKEAP